MGVISESFLPEILDAYYAWKDRRGSYTDYLNRAVSMHAKAIRGKEQKYVLAVADLVFLHHRNRVYRYTRDLIKKLRRDHLLLAVSGSPIEMVDLFGRYFGFDQMWGSVYEIDKDRRYTGRTRDLRSVDHKQAIIKSFLKKNKLTLTHSIGVGDTESDVSFLEMVDEPIAFNPSRRLFTIAKEQHWPIVVERKDVIYHLP